MKAHSTKKKRWILCVVLAALVVLAVAVYGIVRLVTHSFIQSEIQTRESWEIDTGDLAEREAAQQVTVYTDPVEASIEISQIIPDEYEDEGFTYYDEEVQDRLASTLLQLTQEGNYTLEAPLAILNPFGTGSNGLYLYFGTDNPTQVTYTVQAEGYPDYVATANNAGEDGYSRVQEFLLIGLVPGEENTVTLQAVNRQGRERTATFTIAMPEPVSGYDVTLETVDGDSSQALSDGLYYAMGLGGQYGYTFFFDNDGVMRYEMVLEGYHSDRFLWDEDGSLITCVGSNKVARLNRFGQVTQVFDLGQYELHHDINWGPEGTILALATDTQGETVEDQVLQIDLESGQVTHVVDFTQVFQSYVDITRPVQATDPFGLWSEGEWDWLHLNSIQYDERDNSIIVSSRETSTIIKCALGEEPHILWMAGNPDFWEDTEFSTYSLEAEGDFPYQYGQHDVELMTTAEVDALGFAQAEEGQLYLRVYDNNYYAMSSRDDFQVEVPEDVGTANMEDGVNSHVYYYLVDENAGTFTLVDTFDLPYSSLVSNAQWRGDSYTVNNGVHQCFEEYDLEGNLIRQYKYTCTANGYRVMKDDFAGFWFLQL
ncbi:MAG TPA: aryl-sulfate sulfotransferase [Candidatus Acutalibacter pullicola]|uniref:Aryl-sulfate sulfotransferase n=1 Tax=Candidatus Acutalibacter pullicola TaxID=2838417 RepID=A0A9D2MUT7_9FIRM|nr:aryl-sulfate sulfotransferase [Candidatus Acutalibacter pullicola]